MAAGSIRVVPAIYQIKGRDDLTPVIRFVDPQVQDEDSREFFRVHLDHVDMLIAGIRRAAADAQGRIDLLASAGPDDRALLTARTGGQA